MIPMLSMLFAVCFLSLMVIAWRNRARRLATILEEIAAGRAKDPSASAEAALAREWGPKDTVPLP